MDAIYETTQQSNLSNGFRARPPVLDDAEAVTDLLNAQSIALIGCPRYQAHQFLNDWQAPSFNLATDALIVQTGDGTILGYGEVWDTAPHVRMYASVTAHPAYLGQGVGTYLSAWVEARARQALDKAPDGARVTLQQGTMSANKAARQFLEAHGYIHTRYFFRMLIELDAPPPPAVWPAGIMVRTFEQERDLPALIRASNEGFRDHWGYVEHPFEETLADWAQWIRDDPEHDPSLWFLPCFGDEIAALCLCAAKMTEDPEMGYVMSLAVRPAWRRHGLGLAMLHHAFGEYYRRGLHKVSLDVDADSLTGALRLYERAGMHKIRESLAYEKELRPGVELSTVTL